MSEGSQVSLLLLLKKEKSFKACLNVTPKKQMLFYGSERKMVSSFEVQVKVLVK